MAAWWQTQEMVRHDFRTRGHKLRPGPFAPWRNPLEKSAAPKASSLFDPRSKSEISAKR